jgi:hypothetical protein
MPCVLGYGKHRDKSNGDVFFATISSSVGGGTSFLKLAWLSSYHMAIKQAWKRIYIT